MVQKTLKSFYLLFFLTNFFVSFAFTTYVPFLAERGMSNFQINSINAFFMFFVFLLEIPTGSFADTLGRKKSFLISLVLVALGTGLYFFSNSYWLFVTSEIIVAFAWAFSSGATDAWFVDSLKHNGFNGPLESIYSKRTRFKLLGRIFGGLSGAYLGRLSLAWPWLVVAIGHLIVFFLVKKYVKEEYFIKTKLNGFKENHQHVLKLVKDSIRYGIKVKEVFYLISLHAGLIFGFQAFNMYWTLRLRQDLTQDLLGWMWVLISLSMAIGNESTRLISRFIKKQKYSLLVYSFIIGFGCLLAGIFYSNILLMIFFFLFYEFGLGGFMPIKESRIQDNIPSDKRATIGSFDAMIQKLGATAGLLISGLIAQLFSIRVSWIFSAVIIILSGLISFKLNKKKE